MDMDTYHAGEETPESLANVAEPWADSRQSHKGQDCCDSEEEFTAPPPQRGIGICVLLLVALFWIAVYVGLKSLGA